MQEKLETTTIKINSDGFRDNEYTVYKPNNTYRIIVLGDSVAFGLGVEGNETYSEVLENLLNSPNTTTDYEVLNFGVPGYNTLQEVELFKQKSLRYNPDMVILAYHINDIQDQYEWATLKETIRRKINIDTNSLTKAEIVRLASEFETYYMYRYLLSKPFGVLWERIRVPLTKLKEMTNNDKVIILLGTELLWDEQSSYLFNATAEKFKDIAAENNWEVLNIYPTLSKYSRKSLTVGKFDGHLNPLGHEIVGRKIYEFLLDKQLLNS